MDNALQQHLSLCNKAGKLVLGFDAVKEALQKGQVSYIILSAQLSGKTRKEIAFLAKGATVLDTSYTFDDIWFLVGKRTGIVGITDRALGELAARDIAQFAATWEGNT